jgi:hypothetical protein
MRDTVATVCREHRIADGAVIVLFDYQGRPGEEETAR